jgi:hypothetical protein
MNRRGIMRRDPRSKNGKDYKGDDERHAGCRERVMPRNTAKRNGCSSDL